MDLVKCYHLLGTGNVYILIITINEYVRYNQKKASDVQSEYRRKKWNWELCFAEIFSSSFDVQNGHYGEDKGR